MRCKNIVITFAALQIIILTMDNFVMAQSMNACQNYQIFSDERAVTTKTDNSKDDCNDLHLNGWYRFMGDAGTRMLDYCPYSRFPTFTSYHCGGAIYQGWIQSGSMPSLSDGEVSRTVCFSYYGGCYCNYEKAIKIKNCGSYYVYWLNGVPWCSVKYCGVKDETVEVTCSETAMDIKINATHYNPDDYSNITLSDPNCTPTSIDLSYIRFSITPPGQCGSKKKDIAKHIIYENNVRMTGNVSKLTLSVACPYTMDACQNYQILSDARAVTTTASYKYDCSTSYYNGWYRFMGDAGTRMLDYCPYSRFPTFTGYRCGGAYFQGWIQSGSMPSVSDGEVSRTVCFAYHGTCSCYHPRAIKIKNCGSYYVYWLNGVPDCHFTYCGANDDAIKATCSETAIDIKIDASHYNPNEYSNITLNDPNCTPTSIDSSYIRFSITPPDQCGSIRNDTGEYIIYKNYVKMKIRRTGSDVTLPVTCDYMKPITTSEVALPAVTAFLPQPTTPASQLMDGCRHYQILSNATRAVTYATNNDTFYHCEDARLYGWYRFMGEAGTRMLDYCPRKPSDNYNTNRCGAFYQGWITLGSKPDVNDGEVSRLVCYSDYSTCSCRYQNQIKIRNCGSFFVYWITGVPGCSMTYCGVKDKTAEVTCSQTYMQVKLDRSYFNTSNYYRITLRNPACKASWLPSSKYISIGTFPSACGSTRRDTYDDIIYENEIIMKARQTHVSGITRNNDVKLLVRCSYKREGFVSTVSWKPISTINAVEPGFGNFTFYFQMFTGKYYIAAQPYYPVRIKLRDWLYFEARAEVYDRSMVVLLDQCYSTPTMDRNHPQKHSLIEDGCAVDSTVRFINSGGSVRQRFSAQGFKFVNNTAVFVHCIVFICYQSSKEDRCTRGCVGNNVDRARTRRDLSGGYAAQQTTTYSKYYMVDAGPIVFEESPALPSGELPKGPISTTMLVLIAGVGLLAIIIIVLIVKMRRRDAPQFAAVVKQSKSPVEEIGIDNAPNGKEFVISDEVTSSNL